MNYSCIASCGLSLFAAACFSDWPSIRPQTESTDSTVTEAEDEPTGRSARSKSSKSRSATVEAAEAVAPISIGTTYTVPIAATDSLGPLIVDGRHFTAFFQRELYGAKEHVRRLEIRDDRGVVHLEEGFEPPMQERGPEWTTTVRPYVLRGDREDGVVVYYRRQPSSPLTGVSLRLFALRDGRLTPIALPLTVQGKFAQFQESREPHVLSLLPGERLDVEIWQGYFGIIAPFRVRFSGCTTAQPCVRLAVRRGDIVPGLSILQVPAPDREVRADTSVLLYDAPEGKQFVRVPVRRASDVTILEVAADVTSENRNGVTVIGSRREWLHVRIDRVEGWIHGDASFEAIGLKAAG